MEKLLISGRTNWEKKIYIKFDAAKKSMKIMKKIIEEFGDDYFVDNHAIPKTLLDYDKWKDHWIPIVTKDFGIDLICGDKKIHAIFYKFPSFEAVNKVLDKYCKWI